MHSSYVQCVDVREFFYLWPSIYGQSIITTYNPSYIANIELIEFEYFGIQNTHTHTHCILRTHCRPSKQAFDVNVNMNYKIQINEHLHGIVCLEYTCVFIQREKKHISPRWIWNDTHTHTHTHIRTIYVAQSAVPLHWLSTD